MSKRLVIVESPAKARTIAGYLGSDYTVESSIGHIRDLPDRASEVPESKRKRFGALGVDVEGGFEPFYVVDPGKKKVVAALRKKLQEADELLLATDEDREGEAIAWHLVEVLKPKVPVRRMVFHEITRDAIARALEDTRPIDERLVDAQETRRILDRLYGYEVSPVLWKKVTRGLSAGRVQSVATRLVVQRERERIAFVSAAYWDVAATFDPGSFDARLVAVSGRRVAQGRDFAPDGTLADDSLVRLDEPAARTLAGDLEGATFTVRSSDEKPYRRRPAAPFRTATLQQEASRKLRFSAQTTMRLAQRLYEAGYITYMRTDSTTLSESALEAARTHVRELFGEDYVPEKPRRYGRAVANAQEAHEAIRPAGDTFRTPENVKSELGRDEHALYELVWRRTIASQMEDAVGRTVSIRIGATSSAEVDVEFAASGTVISFRGFLAAYEPGRDEPSESDEERQLPELAIGQEVTVRSLEPEGHATTPPPRYTEPTLVKALEDRGIGRPSTYAAILSTIVDRGYVFKRGAALVPTFLAFAVVNLLERHFGQLVDFDFTARMEDDLDRIAAGDEERVAWLTRFYFGNGGDPGLHELVTDHLDEIDARAVNSIPIPGSDGVVRVGRYGPYLERGDARVSLPEDLAPDELTAKAAEELLSQPDGRPLGRDPATGHELVLRAGRYGPYVTEVLPDGAAEKPRTASLLGSMSPTSVSLDDALRLLALPRTLGEVDGEEVTAQNGRYGPYVKKGSESRSLDSEEQLFTISLEEALALLAQPPRRRGRGAAKGPLRELGDDPVSGRAIVLKEGRFGPYVTDGATNASLRRGDTIESVTPERAAELLAERRAKNA
ncbi:MAG TPA: type I DNA topoisomerase [Gaiellaceae bacterium]|nr:type I DNA topoisomerase [Gaiellaceae bacterium]